MHLLMSWMPSLLRSLLLMAAGVILAGCAIAPPGGGAISETAWAKASELPGDGHAAASWEHYRLPGKAQVSFVADRNEGRDALVATAIAAASAVRHKVRIEPRELGGL